MTTYSRSTYYGASFSSFTHVSNPTQRKLSDVHSLLQQPIKLANKIQDMSALKLDFCDLRVLAKKPANPCGHPIQVSTQAKA